MLVLSRKQGTSLKYVLTQAALQELAKRPEGTEIEVMVTSIGGMRVGLGSRCDDLVRVLRVDDPPAQPDL